MEARTLPPRVAALFAAAKAAGYQVVCGRLQVQLFYQQESVSRPRDDKLGGWNKKQHHWYISKLRADAHVDLMTQHGFCRRENPSGHSWWGLDGEENEGAFRSVIEALTDVPIS